MNILMVGVDEKRSGGMWTVADSFINNKKFSEKTNLIYISTSTSGGKVRRLFHMLCGFCKIWKVLRKKRIDIVHVHMAEKGSIYRKGFVLWMSKKNGCKTVIQMHAGPIMDWYNSKSKRIQKTVCSIFNMSDLFLVLGEYWKNAIKEIVAEEKLRVLYNGINVPNKNEYNSNGNIILFLGMIKKTKGAYDLIQAINLIKDELSKDTVVLLCGLDETGTAEMLINEYNLQRIIKMPGWITKAEKISLFKKTKMCVLPTYYEALSMTALESMAYGIPFITTNISTMPEILGTEINLITPGDVQGLAQEILLLEKDLNKRIQYSNIEFFRAGTIFDENKVFERVIEFYEEIICED